MFKEVLQEIGGIGLYGVVSICLFFSVFTGTLILACLHRKAWLDSMSALPLEDAETTPMEICTHE